MVLRSESKYFIEVTLGVLILLAGCASKSVPVTRSQDLPRLVGQRVSITGMAVHNCPGAMVFDKDCQVLVEGPKFWPTNVDRRQVQVTGLLGNSEISGVYIVRSARWRLLP